MAKRGPWKDQYTPLVQSTSDPAVTDSNYEEGTRWINTSTGNTWELTDNTAGAAVWSTTSSGAVSIGTATTTAGIIPEWGTAAKTLDAGTIYGSAVVTLPRQIVVTVGTAAQTQTFSADASFTITPGTD